MLGKASKSGGADIEGGVWGKRDGTAEGKSGDASGGGNCKGMRKIDTISTSIEISNKDSSNGGEEEGQPTGITGRQKLDKWVYVSCAINFAGCNHYWVLWFYYAFFSNSSKVMHATSGGCSLLRCQKRRSSDNFLMNGIARTSELTFCCAFFLSFICVKKYM